MLTFPLHKNVSSFCVLSSFSLQFSLIVESLCLPCTHALSGNDVNRVKCFQGPRGRRTRSDFGVWLTSAEKCEEENTLMFLIFLQRLFLSVTHTVCAAHKSVVHLYIHLVQCVFFGVQHPGGSCRFLFSSFSLPFLSCHTMWSFPFLIATSQSANLHKISDLWDESELPLGRWDID